MHSTELEVGVSDYGTAMADLPHVHDVVSEHQYVMAGRCVVLDIETGTEHHFRAGDFYSVPVGVAHAQKNAAGTRILFVKSKVLNDKRLVPVDDALTTWLADLAI